MGNQDSLTIQLERVCLDVQTPSGGTRRILHPLSLTLAESTVAVIGANGSGKSTLLRVIAGLVEPTSGAVSFGSSVGGDAAVTAGPAVRPPRSGFIFANPQAQLIMPVVGEDIEFSLRTTTRSRLERRRRVTEILISLDLADRIDSSVYELSSGEAQKVALAGVLATEPELVIADEPTTLLDLRNADEFQRRLLSLQVPLVYATHDLDFAARAQRVLVFNGGRLVTDDRPEAAIAYYRKLALSSGPPTPE